MTLSDSECKPPNSHSHQTDLGRAGMTGNDAVVHKRTVSVSEFADMVGISRSLAYQLVAESRVRSVRINRRIVIPLSAVELFLGDVASR